MAAPVKELKDPFPKSLKPLSLMSKNKPLEQGLVVPTPVPFPGLLEVQRGIAANSPRTAAVEHVTQLSYDIDLDSDMAITHSESVLLRFLPLCTNLRTLNLNITAPSA